VSHFRQSLETFFRNKGTQLLAAAAEADTPHAGLLGSHREALIRTFLAPLLPKRFSVGRGMVFGVVHHSRECDVVIWDSDNYPTIPFSDYGHFFAESVRATIESKSRYSTAELGDVLEKSRSVRDIVPMSGMNIADELAFLRLEIASLRAGVPHEGLLQSSPHIATSAIFFRGGQTFSLADLPAQMVEDADEAWPDLVLFLEAGKVVIKQYADSEDNFPTTGYLETLNAGPNALLVFSASLLAAISARSVQVEDPTFLARHIDIEDYRDGKEQRDFRLTRFAPSRVPLWPRGA
jgi:hypothetical protein